MTEPIRPHPPTVLAIIPARAGSKGIPHKNMALCAGKPLVQWTIDAAKESQAVTDIILTTDDRDILHLGMKQGIFMLARDEELAQDDTPTEPVIEDVLVRHIPERTPSIVVLLQPTSPLRLGKHIDEAVAMLMEQELDSVVSVVESHVFLWTGLPLPLPWYSTRPRRQEMRDQYEENGSIYVFTKEHWDATHIRHGGKRGLYVMPGQTRLQVDSLTDLDLANYVMGKWHGSQDSS